MKALKEKRVSLRSLFRRSLVILSLLALVFASCGDSGSSDNGNGNGPGPVDPTPPPATKKVQSIDILLQPQIESYQGLAPNLYGLIADVWFDDGTSDLGVTDYTLFFSVPGYCDTKYELSQGPLGDGTYGSMGIGYKGYEGISNNLKVPMVVEAARFDIHSPTPQDWYSDARPEFKGVTYEIQYPDKFAVFADGMDPDAEDWTGRYWKTKPQPMTPVYPFIDLRDAAAYKKVYAYIDASLDPGAVYGTNPLVSSFDIANYYELENIVPSTEKWADFYDDDIAAFYNTSIDRTDQIGTVSVGGLDPNKVLAALRKSNVKFEATYIGSDKTNTYTVDQFVANNAWFYSQSSLTDDAFGGTQNNLNTIVVGGGGLSVETSSNLSILIVDEETYTWEVTVEYAPLAYSKNAWVAAQIPVPIEVWMFAEEVERKQISNAAVTLPAYNTSITFGDEELRAIKKKWALTASYTKGETGTREIPLTKEMFWDANYAMGVGSTIANASERFYGYSSFFPNASYAEFAETVTGFNVSLQKGQIGRDFPLPVYYRGVLLEQDADMGILVNLIGTGLEEPEVTP